MPVAVNKAASLISVSVQVKVESLPLEGCLMNAVTPKQFTLAQYHQLIELGFLTEGDRIELIRGELI